MFCLGRNPAFAGCFARGLFSAWRGFGPGLLWYPLISYVVIFSATQSTVSRRDWFEAPQKTQYLSFCEWSVARGFPQCTPHQTSRFQPHFTKLTPSDSALRLFFLPEPLFRLGYSLRLKWWPEWRFIWFMIKVPQIIHFSRMFHCKSSIRGSPILGNLHIWIFVMGI